MTGPRTTGGKAVEPGVLSRGQGCLLGQLAGDSLGSLVEFWTPRMIRSRYPDGVRKLEDGGVWETIAGQPTDDSEMALSLARMLAERGTYDPDAAHRAYQHWFSSGPFDYGATTSAALAGGRPNPDSQANGAMMRISPLGIFGANRDLDQVAEWARQDCRLTHPHTVCQQANALFVMAIASAVANQPKPPDLYRRIVEWAKEMKAEESLMNTIRKAEDKPPADYCQSQGWVLIAFQNALWQLIHASGLEEAVVDTVMQGGDTDTNAAICGALMGAVHGREAVPEQWVDALINCRPTAGQPNVRHPRPECFWPTDALDLAERLVSAGR